MGLLDIINAVQQGSAGQRDEAPTSGGGGISPIAIALIGLLAQQAFKYLKPDEAAASPSAGSTAPPKSGFSPAGAGDEGGLSDLLKGGLGGLLGGGAAGSALSGGLNDLLKQFQQKGQSDVADSWVSTGPNKKIDPNTLEDVLGEDRVKTLTKQTGMPQAELMDGLARYLPELVNKLTPKGRVPTADEASRMF